MGSHTRKSKDTGGRSSRGGKGRKGGGGSGGGSGEEKKPTSEEVRIQIRKVLVRSSKKLQTALVDNNFEHAAGIATSAAFVKSPIKENVNLFLAGAKAFKEAKNRRWESKPSEVAGQAVSYAQKKTGYSLSLERSSFINKIISDTLAATAEKQRRKSS